jgi:hypothetical protein
VSAWWGITGVALLLASAIYRLMPLAVDAFSYDFDWRHYSSILAVIVFMAYAEGYRAFQQGFSPRVAARARYLKDNTTCPRVVFAPLFCMAFFHAVRKRQITSISVTAGIVILVLLVRMLSQPWRGIIDGGVVIGLMWGLVSLMVFGIRALTAKDFPFSPEVPEGRSK